MRRPRRGRWAIMLLALSACERGGGPEPPADFASAEVRARGRELYVEHCAICHGERADGRGPRHRSLAARPTSFRDPAWLGRTTPARTFRIVREGVPGTPMAGWKANLEEDAIWDLVSYLHGLARSEAEAR